MNGTINVYDVASGSPQKAAFLQRALERALRFRAYDDRRTELRALDALIEELGADVLHAARWDGYDCAVLEMDNAVVLVQLEVKPQATPQARIDVYATSRQAASLQMARLKELLPEAEAAAIDEIAVSFWYSAAGSGTKVQRKLQAPSWPLISANYTAATRDALAQSMVNAVHVIEKGRLLLWHGAPGTGKTSAVRALARENRKRIAVEYVIDPEAMFGREVGYFVSVLFDEDDSEDDGRMRLLVLEDCDELLSADAKDRTGQGLARLLNLVDGLIGQGLRVAVLITTNEALSAFHPAVSRPGRCGAVIEFELFDSAACAEWLASNDVDAAAPTRASLADLIALRGGHVTGGVATRPVIGFERPARS